MGRDVASPARVRPPTGFAHVRAPTVSRPGGLKPALEEARGDSRRLRDVYLALIKTYVLLGNALKFKPQSREASNLNYQEARRLIAECLGTRGLRHSVADPANDPPEMIAFFDE